MPPYKVRPNEVIGTNESGFPVIAERGQNYNQISDEVLQRLPPFTGVVYGKSDTATALEDAGPDEEYSVLQDTSASLTQKLIGIGLEMVERSKEEPIYIDSTDAGARLRAYPSDFNVDYVEVGDQVRFQAYIRLSDGFDIYRATNIDSVEQQDPAFLEQHIGVFSDGDMIADDDVRSLNPDEFLPRMYEYTPEVRELYAKTNKSALDQLAGDILENRFKSENTITDVDVRALALQVEQYDVLDKSGDSLTHLQRLAIGGGEPRIPILGRISIPFMGKSPSPDKLQSAIPILTKMMDPDVGKRGWRPRIFRTLSVLASRYPEDMRPAIPDLIEECDPENHMRDRYRGHVLTTLSGLSAEYPDDVRSANPYLLELLESRGTDLASTICEILENTGGESEIDDLRTIKSRADDTDVRELIDETIASISK